MLVGTTRSTSGSQDIKCRATIKSLQLSSLFIAGRLIVRPPDSKGWVDAAVEALPGNHGILITIIGKLRNINS